MLRLFKYSFGSVLLLLGVVAGLGGLNIFSYQRLTHETDVAELVFERVSATAYQATLITPDGVARQFVLRGDEWQLDVRMIKWRDWLAFLGEDPLYRLDRISGRYVSAQDTISQTLTAYPLGDEAGLDVWAFARTADKWLPGIDAVYGSSVFLPMRPGVRYRVSMSRTGLVARVIPDDDNS